MLNYKQIWHGIKPIRWLNKFNLTEIIQGIFEIPTINNLGTYLGTPIFTKFLSIAGRAT